MAVRGIPAIFWLGVLALFLELMLIRWISTEIRIFAFFQNSVLVICFLGLGLGCFTSREPFVIRRLLLPLATLVLLLAAPPARMIFGRTSDWLAILGDPAVWHRSLSADAWSAIGRGWLGLGLTAVIMALVLEIFVPIGRLLGRLMDDHPRPLRAYSANVAGSLVGVWLFVLLSFWNLPPAAWCAVAGLILLLFLDKPIRRRTAEMGLICLIVGLSWAAGHEPGAMEVVWSPYQKLLLRKPARGEAPPLGKYMIEVNNTFYQLILAPPGAVEEGSSLFPSAMRGFGQYDIPFLLHPGARTALLLGAGAGNDAAAALRHGISRVTAVDIDPTIIALGRRYHPERPYDSERVRVIVDDARSFLSSAKERYDVVSFGLLDSHTASVMTNTRLDDFVYTRQSLQSAKSVLAEGGILTLSFMPIPFIIDRLGRTLWEVFGEKPLAFTVPLNGYGGGCAVLVAGAPEALRARVAANPRLAALIAGWQRERPLRLDYTTGVATDDWPYLYLESPRIPLLCYFLAGLFVLLPIAGPWRAPLLRTLEAWGRPHWHFFFLGAAFLLLETQNVGKASVVFGSTWLVNAVVISAVLVMVLLANAVVEAFPRLPVRPVYVLLGGTCLALYWVDLARFASLPFAVRIIAVGGLTSLPMLFGGIVFVRSFVSAPRRDAALGANLLGALAGGLLQSVTFATGIKALMLIAAGLYGLALVTQPRLLQTARE